MLYIWNFRIVIYQHRPDEIFILNTPSTLVCLHFLGLRVPSKFGLSCQFLLIIGCFLFWIRIFSSSLGCIKVSFVNCIAASCLRHFISFSSLAQIVICLSIHVFLRSSLSFWLLKRVVYIYLVPFQSLLLLFFPLEHFEVSASLLNSYLV